MITDYLDGLKQTRPNHYVALCPVHGEKTASLSVTVCDDGKTICHCFGCGANGLDVIQALGLTTSELFPDNDNFNQENYQQKKQKQFKRDQFMKDYRLVQLGESWLRNEKKFTRHDKEVFKSAINRINKYKFNAHEVYEKEILKESMRTALNIAHREWAKKSLKEKYGGMK